MCYIKYRDPSSVGVAQHLTNTVFIDRALIVVPCAEGEYLRFGSDLKIVYAMIITCGIFPLIQQCENVFSLNRVSFFFLNPMEYVGHG